MSEQLALLTELLAATADAHSPRALVRAITTTLQARYPIARVELDPELVVVPSGPLPPIFADAEFRSALTQVMAAATRHLDVVRRVAQLSQRAYVENKALRADLDRLEDPGRLIARSPAMRAVMNRVELVARHPTTVLLVGESGSGKEVVAREVHRRSPRAHRPIVSLNCGAIPDGLIESELFGHDRGAFTGADRVHVGAFERANRGTVLLDEVGELSAAAQAKLLRVLQDRRIRRVGGTAEIDVDVRVIAATNRRLADMVERGRFREDLYYRLEVFTIEVPPLRDRRGDLGPLVTALTVELADKLKVAPPPVTKALIARLEAHDWPGNVRELMNVLETALILGAGAGLELPDDVPRRARRADRTGDRHLDAAIRGAIEDALRATRGKIYGSDGAAARLGLKPGTLQSKMRKLRIDRTAFVA